MADRDAWKKAESLSKIFAAVLIPVVLGVASLLANQALEKSKTRDELLKQAIDVVFLFKSDQMAGADKTFESRSPFKPTGYYTSSRWAGGLAISGKVFISYRRSDSAGYAGRVWDRLERDLGRHSLFMDVAAIPLGTNFPKVLHEEVAKCGVLLAMIGPNWLDARDEHKGQLDQAVSSDEQTTADARQSDLAVALGARSLKVLRGQPIRRHDLQSARRVGQTKPEPPMGGKNSVNISGPSEPLARNL
jgi:hypothetical protein